MCPIYRPGGDRTRILEIAEFRPPGKGRGGKRHHRHRADDHESDADPQIGALIADEARSDALVDDIALLEKELPRRHRRADDRDDQQHHVAELAACGELRHDEIARDLPDRRMRPQQNGEEQQTAEDEQQRKPLEAPEIAGAGGGNDDRRRGDDP
jgi:hypothetical protein